MKPAEDLRLGIYEKLMADESGMVYLEVVPAAPESDRPPPDVQPIRSLRRHAAVVGPHDEGQKTGLLEHRRSDSIGGRLATRLLHRHR